jgi:hypothetical protein
MTITETMPDAISPQEHAAVLLEVYRGDRAQAQEACLINLVLGDPRQGSYWCEVLRALQNRGNA